MRRTLRLGSGQALLSVFLLGALMISTIAPAFADGDSVVYVVSPGDNLYRLSLRYRTTVPAILQANGLSDPSFVWVGQRLLIPEGPKDQPATNALQQAQDAAPVPTQAPAKTGQASQPESKPAPIRSGAGQDAAQAAVSHLVEPGQNLFRIALRYGVSMQTIMEANGLSNPNLVIVGQSLIIPGQGPVLSSAEGPVLSSAEGPVLSSAEGAPASKQPEKPSPSQPPPAAAPKAEPALGATPNAPAQQTIAGEPGTIHYVSAGQNLFRISQQYNVSMDAVLKANGITNPNLILVGQRLLIPKANGQLVQGVVTTVGASQQASPSGAPQGGGSKDAPPPGDTFRITFYCLVGPMSSGRWVYRGAAAADQSIFPLGTIVSVADLGRYVIEDRFAWDAGQKRLDIWVPSCAEAIQLGVMYKRLTVIGKQ